MIERFVKHTTLDGMTVPRAHEASGVPAIDTRLLEETDDGTIVLGTEKTRIQEIEESDQEEQVEEKPGKYKGKKPKAKVEQVVVHTPVVPEESKNRYEVTIQSDYGELTAECFDVSVSDSLIVLCYSDGVKGYKFLPKKTDIPMEISIKNLDNDELSEYTVVPIGVIFKLESSKIQCILLEVL